MFVINHLDYNTDNYQKYGGKFYKDLTLVDDETRNYGKYIYFYKGKYVRSYNTIEEMMR